MSKKTNIIATRIGFNKNWKSLWFAGNKADYKRMLQEDLKVREYLKGKLQKAGLDRVVIRRYLGRTEVVAFVARPGVVIGRGGAGIEEIKKELKRVLKTTVDFKVKDLKKPELSAQLIAETIADGMKRGLKHRILASSEMDKAMSAGAKGVRIWISGDFRSPKHSRTDKFSKGFVPIQTLRADIDYAKVETLIRGAGKHGIKVWVNLGERHSYLGDVEETPSGSSKDNTANKSQTK